MDALLAILGSPSAASAVAGLREAAAVVARPFAEALSALQGGDPAGSSDGGHDDGQLMSRVASRLQELLVAAGAGACDCVTMTFDAVTGRVDVDGGALLAADFEAMIAGDEQLLADLRDMAALEGDAGEPLSLLVQAPESI